MMNVIPLYTSPLARPLVRRVALGVAVIALCLAAGVALAGENPTGNRFADNGGHIGASAAVVQSSLDEIPGNPPVALRAV